MDNDRGLSICAGCPGGCRHRPATAAAAPRHLTKVVALLYGVPLMALALAVLAAQGLGASPIASLLIVGSAMACGLAAMTRHGAAIERLLAKTPDI